MRASNVEGATLAAGDADGARLDPSNAARRAARIAALWPAPTRQCAAPPVYLELPAPVLFGMLFQVSWPAPGAALASEAARADRRGMLAA